MKRMLIDVAACVMVLAQVHATSAFAAVSEAVSADPVLASPHVEIRCEKEAATRSWVYNGTFLYDSDYALRQEEIITDYRYEHRPSPHGDQSRFKFRMHSPGKSDELMFLTFILWHRDDGSIFMSLFAAELDRDGYLGGGEEERFDKCFIIR